MNNRLILIKFFIIFGFFTTKSHAAEVICKSFLPSPTRSGSVPIFPAAKAEGRTASLPQNSQVKVICADPKGQLVTSPTDAKISSSTWLQVGFLGPLGEAGVGWLNFQSGKCSPQSISPFGRSNFSRDKCQQMPTRPVAPANLYWPIDGIYRITQPFLNDVTYDVYNCFWHKGIDVGARAGTPIHAAADGTIIYVGWIYRNENLANPDKTGFGPYGIIIKHAPGVYTLYGHAQKVEDNILTNWPVSVSKGQIIGEVGSLGNSTGAHLHYEIVLGKDFSGNGNLPFDWHWQGDRQARDGKGCQELKTMMKNATDYYPNIRFEKAYDQ